MQIRVLIGEQNVKPVFMMSEIIIKESTTSKHKQVNTKFIPFLFCIGLRSLFLNIILFFSFDYLWIEMKMFVMNSKNGIQ